MRRQKTYILSITMVLTLLSTACSSSIRQAVVKSPDGKIEVNVVDKDGVIYYRVNKDKRIILENSKLGFILNDSSGFNAGFQITHTQSAHFDETWEQPWGERQFIRNRYNEILVCLKEKKGNKRLLNIRFRAFDDGIGFRYEFPQQPNLKEFRIMKENTEFRFPKAHKAWWMPTRDPYYESIARFGPINKMDSTVYTPLTIETGDGRYLAIHEANLTDYAKMNLYSSDSVTLSTDLSPWSDGVLVYAKAPFVSPWRTLIIGEKPGDLVTSYMMLNLNEPSKIEDTSWLRPQKYVGIWWDLHMGRGTWSSGPQHGATTENTKKFIDFAAENGFGGVLVEGWNVGWDGNWMKSGNSLDFTKPYPDFDIKAITDYARAKGVQLVGHHETAAAVKNYEAQLESAFAFYQKYGVHIVKTGYVNRLMDFKELHDGQFAVRHYRKVVETAAKYKIAINNHEPVMPTGLQRTWPNLMSQEGVRGQEHDAWSPDGGSPPEHTTVVPFLRGLAGPMDFTFGTFNFENTAYPGTRVQTTLTKQIALYVIIYSPLQMASDSPGNYKGVKAFDFIKNVPVDWSETRVPDAKIGDYAVFARKDRHSEQWYIGAITDENERNLDIKLDFLDRNAKYTAQIYTDGADADWKTNPTSCAFEERTVTANSIIPVRLASGGGAAIRLVKRAD